MDKTLQMKTRPLIIASNTFATSLDDALDTNAVFEAQHHGKLHNMLKRLARGERISASAPTLDDIPPVDVNIVISGYTQIAVIVGGINATELAAGTNEWDLPTFNQLRYMARKSSGSCNR